MNLPILDTDHISLEQQKEHVRQEFQEFMEAETEENKIEEFYDVIQVMLSQLFKEGIEPFDILNGRNTHVRKLISREWDFKDVMEL